MVTAADVQGRDGARTGHSVPALAGDLGRRRVRGSATELGSGTAAVGQGESGDCAESEGAAGVVVVLWRWIVERRFAWLGRYRRLKSDYERLPETTEAVIHIAMIRLMVRRLAV
jgi:putative transposase